MIKMNTEVQGCRSCFVNFKKRPKIVKNKVGELGQKGWDISLKNLSRNNNLRKPLFNSKECTMLSPLSENGGSQEKKFNLHNSIKRKSSSDINNIVTDFKSSTFYSYIPAPNNSQKKIRLVEENDSFNKPDNQTSFQSNMSCFKSSLQTSEFLSRLNIKPEKCEPLRVLAKKSKPIRNNFKPYEFSTNVTKTVSKGPVLMTLSNIMKDQFSFTNMEDMPISVEAMVESQPKIIRDKTVSCSFYKTAKKTETQTVIVPSFKQSVTCSEDRGSHWVQSLQWTAEEHPEGNKKLRNILLGGFADEILKLQRRQKSERVIWEHKSIEKKQTDSIAMTITSILNRDEIVVAKCSLLNNGHSTVEIILGESMSSFSGSLSDYFYVHFQKSLFLKEHLKVGSWFLLLQPWYCLNLKSCEHPVILCMHFESIPHSLQKMPLIAARDPESNICTWKNLSSTVNISVKMEELYFKWNRNITFSARIQRFWKENIYKKGFQNISRNQKFSRLLLQTKDGLFHELLISPHHHSMGTSWQNCIHRGEGKCYIFCNLKIINRFQSKRCPKLFKFLETVVKQNSSTKWKQDYVYQLVTDNISEVSCELNEPDFPDYIPIDYQPFLTNEAYPLKRLSCVAQVLLQYKDILYISDSFRGYVKVWLSRVSQTPPRGSSVLVKEAVIFKDGLLVDEYSQISVLEPSKENITHLTAFNFQNLKISLESKLSDLALIEGEVMLVDENEAYTSLQCSFCLQENLVQDTKQVIYCEDCSLIVTNPILNVKMSVTLPSEDLPNTFYNIQLLPHTIKNILRLDENSYQPQCCTADVLGKKLGPLLCYIRGHDTHRTVFYLSELNSSSEL